MNQTALMRAIPALAVIGLAVYSVWEEAGPPFEAEKKAETASHLDKDLYEPLALPAPARNPFDMMADRPRIVTDRDPPTPVGAPGSSTPSGTPTATTSPAVAENPAAQFTLGATMLSGPRRSALINGRIYDIGEVIASSSPQGARDRYRLISVERDGVMLQGKAPRPVVVTFAGARKPAAPAPDVEPVAESPMSVAPSSAEMDIAAFLGRSGGGPGQPAAPVPIMTLFSLLGFGASHP